MISKLHRAASAVREWLLVREIASLREQAEALDQSADFDRAAARECREKADQAEMRLCGLQLQDSVIGELDDWPDDVEHLEPRR